MSHDKSKALLLLAYFANLQLTLSMVRADNALADYSSVCTSCCRNELTTRRLSAHHTDPKYL